MIVTLTPNPALDRTVAVPELVRGAVHRASRSRSEPSGKGVNVSLALATHGVATTAVLPLGGGTGRLLAHALRGLGLPFTEVPVDGETRVNVSVVEADGTVTKVNEPGPHLRAEEVAAVLGALRHAVGDATWVASCGSLPPGAPVDLHARVVELAHVAGARCVVDSSGPALAAALAAGPDLVKPNADELAGLVGRELATLGDVRAACDEVLDRGAAAVLASLGADGALLARRTGAGTRVLVGRAPVDRVVSTVGAGDALLAGFLSAADEPDDAALRTALRWGAAAVGSETTLFRLDGPEVPVTVSADLGAGAGDAERSLAEVARPA